MINNKSHPIDVVICWVNGSDPLFKQKLSLELDKKNYKFSNEEFSDERFAPSIDIYICLLSIKKYAPFVNKIFIVTDQQDPFQYIKFDSIKDPWFDKIQIIDHKEIFRDHLEFLPVFNSLSIETLLFKIKSLSEPLEPNHELTAF